MQNRSHGLMELGMTLIRMGLGEQNPVSDARTPSMALVADLDEYVVKRQRWGHEVAESGRASVERALREWIAQCDPKAVVAAFGVDEFAILFDPPADQPALAYAASMGEALRCLIAERSPFTGTLGVGGHHPESGGLAASIQEAMTAKQRKLLYGGNQVVMYAPVGGGHDGGPGPAPPRGAPVRLVPPERTGGPDALNAWLTRLRDTPGATPQAIRTAVAEVLLAWLQDTRLAAVGGSGGLPMSEYLSLMSQLEEIHDYSYLEQWLGAVAKQILDECRRLDLNQRITPVRRALQVIADRCDEDLTLTDLAKEVYVNPFYLSRLFRQELGVTFVDTLIRARMERATALLISSSLSVADVAEAVGYRDEKHFRTLFKERVGVTPSHYRRNNRTTQVEEG